MCIIVCTRNTFYMRTLKLYVRRYLRVTANMEKSWETIVMAFFLLSTNSSLQTLMLCRSSCTSINWNFATHSEHLQKHTKLVAKLAWNKYWTCNACLTGVFYYQLGNLSPKYRSSLSSIHLVSIAKSSIIQKYGPDKILEPFMADIKELEKVIRLKIHTAYNLHTMYIS